MDEFTQHALLVVTIEITAMVAGVAIEYGLYERSRLKLDRQN